MDQRPDRRCVIAEPYLLALAITLRRDEAGHWADPSWAKDLLRHCDYLTDLTLFCPVERAAPGAGWVRVDRPGLRIAGYPAPHSWGGFLWRSPGWLRQLTREVRRARIVHSGVAGWPVPPGWAAAPLAKRHRKLLVLIVESTFWRVPAGTRAGRWRRWLAAWWEWAARRCMALADYAAYTQPEYRRSLPARRAAGEGRLVQASWVDAADCLSDGAAEAAWAAKRPAHPRFLFAARLVPEKGTTVLARTLERLAARDAALEIDILGEGPDRALLAQAADTPWGRVRVRLLDPVPYDRAFLQLVERYHALLVPGLSDEQPRIVYDGYARGVPALGSDLAGLRACIADGETGRLIPPNDPDALADAMIALADDPAQLRAWGQAGLRRVRERTHERLHGERCRDLRRLLNG